MRNRKANRELIQAIVWTQEYAQLPAIEGWSWYDALVKYAPGQAERLRLEWERDEAIRVSRIGVEE